MLPIPRLGQLLVPYKCPKSTGIPGPQFSLNIPKRDDGGFQLIEVLVSVVISGIIMAAVMSQLTSSQRFTTQTRNQVIASDIIQEIVDNARNLSWNELLANVGTHELRVNQLVAGQANDNFFPRPLIQDRVNLNYSDNGELNMFRADAENGGRVRVVLTNQNNGSVRVDITVTWAEHAKTRTQTATTVIAQTGIHN